MKELELNKSKIYNKNIINLLTDYGFEIDEIKELKGTFELLYIMMQINPKTEDLFQLLNKSNLSNSVDENKIKKELNISYSSIRNTSIYDEFYSRTLVSLYSDKYLSSVSSNDMFHLTSIIFDNIFKELNYLNKFDGIEHINLYKIFVKNSDYHIIFDPSDLYFNFEEVYYQDNKELLDIPKEKEGKIYDKNIFKLRELGHSFIIKVLENNLLEKSIYKVFLERLNINDINIENIKNIDIKNKENNFLDVTIEFLQDDKIVSKKFEYLMNNDNRQDKINFIDINSANYQLIDNLVKNTMNNKIKLLKTINDSNFEIGFDLDELEYYLSDFDVFGIYFSVSANMLDYFYRTEGTYVPSAPDTSKFLAKNSGNIDFIRNHSYQNYSLNSFASYAISIGSNIPSSINKQIYSIVNQLVAQYNLYHNNEFESERIYFTFKIGTSYDSLNISNIDDLRFPKYSGLEKIVNKLIESLNDIILEKINILLGERKTNMLSVEEVFNIIFNELNNYLSNKKKNKQQLNENKNSMSSIK